MHTKIENHLQKLPHLFLVLNVAAGKAPMQSSVAEGGIPQVSNDGIPQVRNGGGRNTTG